MSDDEAINVGQYPQSQQNNFIRLSYDSVNRQLTLTMRCFSTLVSLLSPQSRFYLYSNNMVIASIFVLINNRVWKVSRVNKQTNTTLLFNPDNESESMWVDTSIVEENVIKERQN